MSFLKRWWWVGAIAIGIYLWCNSSLLGSLKSKLGLGAGPTGPVGNTVLSPSPGPGG